MNNKPIKQQTGPQQGNIHQGADEGKNTTGHAGSTLGKIEPQATQKTRRLRGPASHDLHEEDHHSGGPGRPRDGGNVAEERSGPVGNP